MPSPVGHGLAAVAIGWAVAGPVGERGPRWRQAATLAAIGMAADLDLLIGRHSAETHSVGAALLVASVAAWWRWPVAAMSVGRWRVWLAVFLAWLSHPILDALALDTSPPLGVMLFWPIDSGYHQTGWSVFAAISRRYWRPEFVTYNIMALLRELAILVPIVWMVRSSSRTSRRSTARTDKRL